MDEKIVRFSRPHENDLVFRRDAIEAIIRETNRDGAYGYGDTKSLVNVLDALPSVQSEPLHINLNEWVKVKLTDLGKEIYYHQYDNINKAYGKEIVKPSFPSEDKDGYTRFQLWEFIQLYGPHIGIGAPNVIDPLEIVYEGGKIMRELIEKQAAIDAHCELCGDRHKCNSDICPDVEVFQLIPTIQPELKWISCSERLPEIDELVLVTDDSGGVKTVDVDRCGQYECSEKRFWYYTQNVVAWMPLPKPYTERRE